MTVDPNRDELNDVIIYGDGSDDSTRENSGWMSADRIVISDDKAYLISLATGNVEEIDTTGI